MAILKQITRKKHSEDQNWAASTKRRPRACTNSILQTNSRCQSYAIADKLGSVTSQRCCDKYVVRQRTFPQLQCRWSDQDFLVSLGRKSRGFRKLRTTFACSQPSELSICSAHAEQCGHLWTHYELHFALVPTKGNTVLVLHFNSLWLVCILQGEVKLMNSKRRLKLKFWPLETQSWIWTTTSGQERVPLVKFMFFWHLTSKLVVFIFLSSLVMSTGSKQQSISPIEFYVGAKDPSQRDF